MERSSHLRSLQWVVFFFCLLLTLITGVGIFWAFSRGGRDFAVFYEAWRLVTVGQGAQIYHQSPDRFLYSPGFAWVLSPIAYLPYATALALWCAFKVLALIFLIKKLTEPWMGRGALFGWLGTILGILVVSKPLLIDFEYGQVNLLILAASVWALSNRFESQSSLLLDAVKWCIFSFVAFAKVFPLPFLFVPFLVTLGVSKKKLIYERMGLILGFVLTFAWPFVDQGFVGFFVLLQNWAQALMLKGLPLESHNQSFTALLFHYLSGIPTAVRSEGPAPLFLGVSWLMAGQITLLSNFWTATALGLEIGWLLTAPWRDPAKWVAVAIGFLIIPSHLIWKTYFVMSAPLAVFLIQMMLRKRNRFDLLLLALVVIGINLSGFDFMGHSWAAYLEAASLFLLLHLCLMVRVATYRGP